MQRRNRFLIGTSYDVPPFEPQGYGYGVYGSYMNAAYDYFGKMIDPGLKVVIEVHNERWPGDGSTWLDGKMVDPPGTWDV